MIRLKSIFALVAVFLAGLLIGVVGTRMAIRQTVRTALNQPDRIWARFERRLASDLDLTPEQRVKAEEIFATARQDLVKLRSEVRPRYRQILEKAQDDLAVLLTPEQREKMERVRARRPFLLRRGEAVPGQ